MTTKDSYDPSKATLATRQYVSDLEAKRDKYAARITAQNQKIESLKDAIARRENALIRCVPCYTCVRTCRRFLECGGERYKFNDKKFGKGM